MDPAARPALSRREVARALLAGLLAAAAPEAARAEARPLTVFAASDLGVAFRELGPRFERAQGGTVSLVFGSTGRLAAQIEQGAPADVFFAADEAVVAGLTARGIVLGPTATLYAQGRLVLATSRRLDAKLSTLPDLLDRRVRHVAIANPRHAPYGRAAQQALERVGIWPAVRPKLVYGENVRQALQFVQTGAAEAGIVAWSIVEVPEVAWTPVDPRLHAPLNQVAVVVARSPHRERASAFLRFVTGAEGRAVLRRYGFVLPGEPGEAVNE